MDPFHPNGKNMGTCIEETSISIRKHLSYPDQTERILAIHCDASRFGGMSGEKSMYPLLDLKYLKNLNITLLGHPQSTKNPMKYELVLLKSMGTSHVVPIFLLTSI